MLAATASMLQAATESLQQAKTSFQQADKLVRLYIYLGIAYGMSICAGLDLPVLRMTALPRWSV